MKINSNNNIPADGIQGLKQNFVSDATSGFIIFLLALPLSLGIAKASDFPPIMGLITAIIGGMVVSFFMGSRLTIKGPAAGLIVIVAGAVNDFGGGEIGWRLSLGAMVIAGLLQIIFGTLKLGKLADFFPLSAIHGMLAAIGLLIIAKQIPILLNVDPALFKGLSPIGLFGAIPTFIKNLDPRATGIGVVSMAVMLGWPFITNPIIKKIPAPLVVLLIAIPAELYMDFQHTEPERALVHIGNLTENLKYNADFSGWSQTGTFIKYVIMFALVGSIESLLTVKAIDLKDPYQRKSNTNQDLIAVGIGNVFAALLGGLPMISEVARSSANVANGAKTRWANFFHGFFILTFILLAAPLIELIPNTALAAMLITVGIKLAHPKEFIHTYHIGREQLIIFVTTIVFTIAEDLLIGIAAGIVLKIVIHLINGVPFRSFFKLKINQTIVDDNVYRIQIFDSANFANYLKMKTIIDKIPQNATIIFDLSEAILIDHTVMENLHHCQRDFQQMGGEVIFTGLDKHIPVSNHEFAARKKSNTVLS